MLHKAKRAPPRYAIDWRSLHADKRSPHRILRFTCQAVLRHVRGPTADPRTWVRAWLLPRSWVTGGGPVVGYVHHGHGHHVWKNGRFLRVCIAMDASRREAILVAFFFLACARRLAWDFGHDGIGSGRWGGIWSGLGLAWDLYAIFLGYPLL